MPTTVKENFGCYPEVFLVDDLSSSLPRINHFNDDYRISFTLSPATCFHCANRRLLP